MKKKNVAATKDTDGRDEDMRVSMKLKLILIHILYKARLGTKVIENMEVQT